MKQRTRRLALPIVLIALGVIFLLINSRILSSEALQRLGDLWPLLLVILGLQLVFTQLLGPRRGQIAGLAAAAIIVIAAIAYGIAGPPVPASTPQQESAQRMGA
jgi:membrane protease YdiL (CAAX protease family)